MKIPLDLINGIRIANPCPASWRQMAGDDCARHCSLCDQTVYDLSAMTADEVALLLGAHDEDVCVRLYRRADGTVMTRDCPNGVGSRIRGYVFWAAVAVVTLLGFFLLRGLGNSTVGPATRRNTMGKLCTPQAVPQAPAPAAPENQD